MRHNGCSFNSLQAGKSIQTSGLPQCSFQGLRVSIPFKRESPSKPIEKENIAPAGVGVSIPFKRESPSKQHKPTKVQVQSLEFQFPSSGKVHPNYLLE